MKYVRIQMQNVFDVYGPMKKKREKFKLSDPPNEAKGYNIKNINRRFVRYNKRNPTKPFADDKIRWLMGLSGVNDLILSFVGDDPFLPFVCDPRSWTLSTPPFLPESFLVHLKKQQTLHALSRNIRRDIVLHTDFKMINWYMVFKLYYTPPWCFKKGWDKNDYLGIDAYGGPDFPRICRYHLGGEGDFLL